LLVIGRISAGFTHDLNGALGVIVNAAALLRRDAPDDPNVEAILEASAHAAESCRRLAALSQLGDSRRVGFDPSPCIERLVRFLQGILGDRHRIACVFDAGISAIIANPFDLEREIAGLVMDARDALPTGDVITIRTRMDRDDVMIEVHSHGRVERLRYTAG
jgi:signal transduction histidine kinase